MRTLLLIDDEADQWEIMFGELNKHGFRTVYETNPDNALDAIRRQKPDVILLDLQFPGDDLDVSGKTTGADLLAKIQKKHPEIPVVVFTTRLTDNRLALETINMQHYYAKEQIANLRTSRKDWASGLVATLEQAISDFRPENNDPENLCIELGFVVGETASMQDVARLIRQVAGTSVTVLIEGETGTGKELAARAIHRLSGRENFLALNCSGVHLETLESRLFGHEKGSFTSAHERKIGIFEQGDKGTVFLDEIQAMPIELQNKLMRVIQDKKIQRIGSQSDIPVDIRLIVATNKPGNILVNDGLLREDLYFRLAPLKFALSPLRDRKQDIRLLWPVLIDKANKMTGREILPTLRDEVLKMLENHNWPGNIRELENVILGAAIKTKGNMILPQDIAIDKASSEANAALKNAGDLASALAALRAEERYDFLVKNTSGDLQKDVLIEIIRTLQAKHPEHKVTSKELTKYLCGSSNGNDEQLKKDDQKVRTRIHSLDFRISDI